VLPLPAPEDKAALQAQVTFTLISNKNITLFQLMNKAQTIFIFLSEIWIVSGSKARDPEFRIHNNGKKWVLDSKFNP
jgi:hypothetical protein